MLGAAVTDLGPEENTVREDGVERALVEVRLANFPIKLMILVDNGDVMNNRLTHFRDGLTAMLQALPENQVLSILTLARQPGCLGSCLATSCSPSGSAPRAFCTCVSRSDRLGAGSGTVSASELVSEGRERSGA